MAANKYSRRVKGDSKAKPVIITIAAVLAVIAGILGYLYIKANEDRRIASLRFNFNRFYPDTYNSAEELDPSADYDGDGIPNSEEVTFKTSLISADSDSDGLTDKDEQKYGTSATMSDCDGDGIPDGLEILAGLDPLSPITDGHNKDADKKFTRIIEFDDGSLTISGTALVFGASFDKIFLNAVSSNTGAVTLPYELYSENGFDSATLSFRYNSSVLTSAGIDTSTLKIFRFDPYGKSYTPLENCTAGDDGTVSCPITENGVYVLGADSIIQKYIVSYDENVQMNIHLLIDNSGSMYSREIQPNSEENDVKFKRLSFAQKFVSALDNRVKFAITAFTYEFKNLCGFDADKSHVMQAITSIRSLGAGFDGTSVERALMLGLESFDDIMKNDRNIIILLTDGISTDTAGYTLDNITALAKVKNVTIMTISLGNDIDRELLQNISNRTGGKYFPISEANVLEGLYSTMIASMEDDIVDDDYDGTPDSYTLYDTGFNPDVNGFSFNNFKSKTNTVTLDFGMVMLARDWFKNNVPASCESEEKKLSYTFEGTTINTSETLRKVVLATMQSPWLKPENYLNFLSGGETLKVSSEDAKSSQGMGWSKITIPYEEPGTSWVNAEILVPDHVIKTIRTKYSENDLQMIGAIHYYDSFRGTGQSFTLNSEADFNKVKNVLSTGTPIVTKIFWEDENGACYNRYVLLTTLRRDLENPNIFRIKIYDVNSESSNTITVNRTVKITSSDSTDYSYTANWNNRSVSLTCFLTKVE